VRMREQKSIEAPEAGAATQQLSLCALTAIDRDAMTGSLHKEARMVPLGRRHAGGRAEEGQIDIGRDSWRVRRAGADVRADYI
jgi:hypothetical protein